MGLADINIGDQIKMLIELQQFDAELFDMRRTVQAIPERIDELDSALEEKMGNMKRLEEEQKKTQLKHKEKETDLAAKEESAKKYQTQLFQVKTNKEYSALEKEIASIKADSSLLEEEILLLFDEVDGIKQKIATEKEILEGEKKKIDLEKKTLADERNVVLAELKGLDGKRKEFAANIDKNVLSRYERILDNRNGLAMVPIVGGCCGGCNMNLPPQVVNEAKMMNELTVCGNCARLLFSET
ncbi:MAG: C4-type zinc ribbon domain-containing protein [Candidatus Omnitrophota bacterium]